MFRLPIALREATVVTTPLTALVSRSTCQLLAGVIAAFAGDGAGAAAGVGVLETAGGSLTWCSTTFSCQAAMVRPIASPTVLLCRIACLILCARYQSLAV